MNELFEKEGQSIFAFKPGDIIIRLKRVEFKKKLYNENLGIFTEVVERTDRSYREPTELVAIENNMIYLRSVKPSYDGTRHLSMAELEYWSEDWALFVVPEGLKMEDCC